MHFLYNFAIYFYWFLIFIASLFGVEKAKKWILGRKNKFKNWVSIPSDKTIYWFHCASLGEFDQGSPLMHKVKSKDPRAFILVTFFLHLEWRIFLKETIAWMLLITCLLIHQKKQKSSWIFLNQILLFL